jgi:hypothetical protein
MRRHAAPVGSRLDPLVLAAAVSVTSMAHAGEPAGAPEGRGPAHVRLEIAADPRRETRESGAEAAFYSATGLVGRMTQVRLGPDEKDGQGGGLWFSTVYYGTQSLAPGRIGAVVRSRFDAGFGAGNRGIEGALDIDLMGGHRLAVGALHGPFLRYGLRALLEGDRIFYASRLELPALALGYQYFTRTLLVEVSGRGSAVLVGRYAVGDAPSRRLGNALGWGGQGALLWHAVSFELAALRIELEQPVHVLEARLCSGAGALLLCSSLARHSSEIGGEDTSSVVTTINVGAALQGRSGR